MQRQTFEIRVNDVPGLLARVESLFRRQSAPIRSFHFEGSADGPSARLRLVTDADDERSGLLQRQLRRLEDVLEVHRRGLPAAPAAEEPAREQAV